MEAVEATRKTPRQARSRAVVAAILEAAAQLLERDGEAGFNTNAVAARAGVSIGSLYRYFPDKRAILSALAQRETEAHHAALAKLASDGPAGVAPDRAMIRAFLQAFGGRAQARRVAMTAWFATADWREIARMHERFDARPRDAEGRPLSPIAAFVLSRAVQGAMRAAVLEGTDFLTDPEFEDELVRLGRAFVKAPRSGRRSSAAPAGGSRSGSSPASGRGSAR